MDLQFIIDRDDISDERLAEYMKVLNEMLGIEGRWKIVRGALIAHDNTAHQQASTVNETAPKG